MEISDLTSSTNKATIQILCLPNLPSSNKLSVFTPTISLILCLFWSKLGCVHTGVLKSIKLPCFEMCNHIILCVWHVYVNAAYKCCMKNILFSLICVSTIFTPCDGHLALEILYSGKLKVLQQLLLVAY